MARFVILGEAYTERIRDLWASKNYSKAIEYALSSIDGMTLDYLIPIIDGTKQLVGKELDYIDDNFHQDFKYVDVFQYADMNSDRFQRIYNDDITEGRDIIRWFSNLDGYLWKHEDTWQMKVARWNKLLPDVKNDLSQKIPYWMSLFLRRYEVENDKANGNNLLYEKNRIGKLKSAPISNKSLLYQYFDEISTSREKFDKKCTELYLYHRPDLDEIWESMQRIIKRYNKSTFDETDVVEPSENKLEELLEEALVKDIKMTSKNGWLSPLGTYYTCEHGGHSVLANLICEKYKYPITEDTKNQYSYSDVLLKLGWIQIHQPERWERFRMTHKNKITYDQNIKIERYEAVHKIKLEDII